MKPSSPLHVLAFAFISAAVAPFAGADDFIVTNEDDRFFMKAKDCEGLKAEVEAIKNWKFSLSEPTKGIEVDCGKGSPEQIEITEILPNYFKKLSGRETVCYGPNCFNFALLGHKIAKHPRAVLEDELTLVMHLFCEDVSFEANSPRPGDIGIIRERVDDSSPKEIHAFNFIGETVATKNGEATTAKLHIEDRDSMLSLYQVASECRNPKMASDQCRRFIKYFRCATNEPIGESAKAIEALEEKIGDSLFKKDIIENLGGLREMLDSIKADLSEEATPILREKVKSIEYQFSRIEPEEEVFLLEVINKKKERFYPAIRIFLKRSFVSKKEGKSFPFIFKPLVLGIIKKNIKDFNISLSQGAHLLLPSTRKKVDAFLNQ